MNPRHCSLPDRARGWLNGVVTSTGAPTPAIDQTYTRNAKGQISNIRSSRTGSNWDYYYDGQDRLTYANNPDSNAERVRENYDPD